MNMIRGTYAAVNLKAIEHNLDMVKNIIGDSRKILFPVKADAYGHGALQVARHVEKSRSVDYFGVASVEEGIELREGGVSLPILVLGFILPSEDTLDKVLHANLILSVGSIQSLEHINAYCSSHQCTLPVHLKIDTGMGRLGVQSGDARTLALKALNMKQISVEGVFSHMPLSDDTSEAFNITQINRFHTLVSELKGIFGEHQPIFHLANSGALMHYPSTIYDMVRPGIMSYGYLPSPFLQKTVDIKPSMTLISQVQFTKYVKKGTPLSYGHTYWTPDDCYISTISCGYGDGYFRCLSNKAHCRINGDYYPLVGRICMDLLMVNTGSRSIPEGTPVEMFGSDGITADTLATLADTISYEITCNIAKRVPRVYKS